ncbi:LuxR C-terminal-related transcriptional regulator [Pararcticibacter amylolyticus]|uniref:HTH luxR-type domain-containing protein n=1 Tax=Pararcticibacter amylolyticus TaxID=2173175 RepID=A0A2U2PAK0_9SPHI|nr:LuxR C-terminal-related transcriptional regulator [Pararcticibacter amylolyticus]PWG78426.1 hypothetical protein DDR33_22365 [Pararcticibacter amylolyticus]
MSVIRYDEVKKVWREIARNAPDRELSFELELHKKLLNIFHVGPYYHYIFNCSTTQMEYVSDAIIPVLGLSSPDIFTIEYLLEVIHPEDLPYFIGFEKQVTRFFNDLPPDKVLKYKVSYDYRIRHTDGTYARILQQVVTIQADEQGAVIRVLGVHTDITHLNKPPGSTLSFIGLDGEPSYYHVCEGRTALLPRKSIFTRREKEVLQYVLQGKTSQEIADALFISKLTVDGHRKKLLRKAGVTSAVELTTKVLRDNLLGF